MKLDNYRGYNDEMKYKEGVLTLLEELLNEVKELRQLVTPPVIETPVEPVKEVIEEVKPKAKRKTKKEVV